MSSARTGQLPLATPLVVDPPRDDAAWFAADWEALFIEAPRSSIHLDCKGDTKVCLVHSENGHGLAAKRETHAFVDLVKSVPTNFANASLLSARHRLQTNPDLWSASDQRDVLRVGRALLESDSRAKRCVDVGAIERHFFHLCELDKPVADGAMHMLIMPTMLGSCHAKIVYCVYFTVSIRRLP